MGQMFCFQCEQTAGGSGCKIQGVCGKSPIIAAKQDELIGSLIGFARKSNGKISKNVSSLIKKSLFTTITMVNYDEDAIKQLIEQVHKEQHSDDYDMKNLWDEPNVDIRSLKSLLLFGLKGLSAYAYHAKVLGFESESYDVFVIKALKAIGDAKTQDELLPLVLECGKVNLEVMELLDKSNTEKFGTPEPTSVTLEIEKGPFIVITGHDLHDLKELLEQTKDKGINIYTHGEMLPAHGYPELKKYKHLKGNFGTAWQNQQKEFDNIPAPILYTTNCLMLQKESYKNNVFTTEAVGFPERCHIESEKDFSPVIKKALELGGYKENQIRTGINGGKSIMTGFSHGAVLENADKIIAAVKSGAIKHFFLVGGCDGAKMGRSYYTEFVEKSPKDTIILTLACGKYRFNDLDVGEIGGFPRIMDMGQCNDAFSAIKVALALSEAFKCDVNELPLSLILSWYEQKAVVVLLTLLHLGIKNIKLGPTLPAFVSPNVLDVLVKNFAIAPITTADADLKQILGN